MAEGKVELGDMLVSLCYNAPSSKLKVIVLKCRGLPAKDLNGYSDPYVKLHLMHNGRKVEKKKTAVKEKTLNPVYNESFVFNVSNDKIRNSGIVLQVMDHDKLGRNDFMGQVLVSGRNASKQWRDMLAGAGQTVSYWHTLEDES